MILGKKGSVKFIGRLGILFIEALRKPARNALKRSKHFIPQGNIDHMAHMADKFVSQGNQTGEGWFLTGEMLELIKSVKPNQINAFNCL